ncbi:hypothetical protein FMM05_08605 [Flavobacterium zepuense]|uniref:HNH endonuclease 5 domain-containing protein n=1 Tax=Flavobacterium zepuense TaxID=2593302 RepID=A0A552V4F0_9FLAO|nr:hypothetical protein [Flavobacterium zepuense]TRW25354.1 hypothetical protein FMM05_08605 [Flavobacterium zepuense]
MSKTQEKRHKIFNIYSKQLHSLVDNGLSDIQLKFEKTYICPICYNQFSEADLDTSKESFLTLEDAPPKSLGGKANTLTCNKCNNEFGHTIDFHLAEYINEADIHAFLPNTGSRVKMTHKGIRVQGIVNVDADGKITITHIEKINNPKVLKDYVAKTGKDDIADLEFPASRVEFKKFEIALLKTAYILAFEKFGYPLILSKAFDIVRDQLRNPEKNIYSTGFWSRQSVFNKSIAGVLLIITPGFEGFQAIFVLATGASESGYGVYLPISYKTAISTIENFKKQEAGFGLKYESYQESDYFNDESNQKMCVAFMNKHNK